MSVRTRGILVGVLATVLLVVAWPRFVGAGARGRCTGTVTSTTGAPIEGASVTLLRPDQDGEPRPVARTWTDECGGFALAAEAAGTGGGDQLAVAAPEFVPHQLPAGTGPVAVRLTPSVAIQGRVVDDRGRSVAGARLFAAAVDDARVRAEACSRWDGSFRLRVPPGRAYVVGGALADGTPLPARSDVRAGAADCELRLLPRTR